jgi:hypothetical protein
VNLGISGYAFLSPTIDSVPKSRPVIPTSLEPSLWRVRSPVMGRDFSVFAQPGFWISPALLGLLFAAAVAVIAYSSNYPVPSQLG